MTEEALAITNNSHLESPVDVTVSLRDIGGDDEPSVEVVLAEVDEGETFDPDPGGDFDVIVSTNGDAEGTINNVEHGGQVVAGLIVDTTDADTSTFEGTLEIDAVRSDHD